MKREWNVFRSTIMFLTRIPVGNDLPHDPVLLQHTPKYFAVVGWLVGGVGAAVFGAAMYWFNQSFSILLSMAATILLTGAFHEDGFADVCDAFGGGWTKESILTIMKDSRLGTYGVVGIVLMLMAKFMLLQMLLPINALAMYNEGGKVFQSGAIGSLTSIQFALLLMAGHSVSRLAPVTIIQQYHYVTDIDASKSKPLASSQLPMVHLIVAVITALLPLLFLPHFVWLALIPVAVARIWLARYFNKWIGGYTGDCLGATQQVCEITFYAAVVAIYSMLY
jgi:adenosylcobinamide-GDP ribazoletransferase